MKKSLFALAAVGAFAGAAQAQSSVTVYGILDVGFQGVTTRGPLSSSSSQNTNTNITRFSGEGSETTSRLGFRGTEDLGGGTSAFFTVEFGLSPTDATLSGNTGNGLFNRQTFVGIGQKGIGQAAIGTQYTPVHMAVGRTDPGQQNNMIGSAIYTTNASQGSGQTATSYTVRYNNALTLQTDRFAGLQVNAIYNNNNTNANNTIAVGGTNNSTGTTAAANGVSQQNNTSWGVGVNYVLQKLNVDLAYQTSANQSIYANANATVAAVTSAVPGTVNAPANVLGTNLNMNQFYAGAVYDFGILKAYVQYLNTKYENRLNANIYLNRSAQQIGVRGNITKTIEGWASAGNGSYGAAALNSLTATTARASQNFTAYQVGANYWLSKRTNMYAIFGSTQVSASSVNISEGASSYGVGVRHTF
jgi:predicted porin